MMKLELFLLLFLVYFGLENGNKRIIRKLDESYDTESDIWYSSEPSSEEENYSSDSVSDSQNNNYNKESKLFLIGFGNYSRPDETFLNFIIFFKKYKIFQDLPENIIITVVIDYLRQLRFLKERNVNCSKIKDENNAQYNCIVKEIDPYQTISKLSITTNIPTGLEYMNLIYSSYAKKAKNAIQDQTGDELKEINSLNNAIVTDIDSEAETFTIEGNSEKNIIDNEVIFSYYRNEREDLNNFTCNVSKVDLENKKYKFTCNPQSSINSNLDGIIGEGEETKEKILINFEQDGNLNFYLDKNNGKKMSSGGLAGGAIAGIVIACVVILLVLAIIIITCKKSSKPPKQESESDIDIYNNNSDAHQNSSNKL